MASLIIASIGNRDPGTADSPTGPLRLARQIQPDSVILFATDAVRAQAEATRDALLSEFPSANVSIEIAQQLYPNSPNLEVDIERLLYCGRELIRRHRDSLEAASHIAVCFTSGTPQISIALTLVTRALLPNACHYQALNPDQVVPGTDLLRQFDPDILARLQLRDRIFDALARGDHLAVLQIAETLGKPQSPPWNQRALDVANTTAKALNHISQYRRSELRLVTYPQVKNLAPEVRAYVQHLQDWFRNLAPSGHVLSDRAWGAEIAAHALRLLRQNQPTLALITAAIATEILITAAIRGHGIDPDEICDVSPIPDAMRERLRPREPEGSVFRIEGSRDRSELLAALDPTFRSARENGLEGLRDKIAKRRNNALHAGKPPDAEVIETIPQYLNDLTAALSAPNPTELPTSPDNLQQLAAYLQQHT